MPTVGVVVPYSPQHTPASMLAEARDSVASQSVPTELYVVEDGDQRGPAWARNRGIERANEQYVAFLDADDRWKDGKLTRQLDRMATTGTGLCVEGNPELETEEFIRDLFTGKLTSLTSSILIDTAQVSTRFEETLERKEDHLFMLEAASEAGVCLCPDLVEIRKHDEGLSRTGDHQVKVRAQRRFVELAGRRVPEVDHWIDDVAASAWFGSGRGFHYRGEYVRALRAFWQSARYRPSLKIVPAVVMVFCHWLSPFHPREGEPGDLLTSLWQRLNGTSGR